MEGYVALYQGREACLYGSFKIFWGKGSLSHQENCVHLPKSPFLQSYDEV